MKKCLVPFIGLFLIQTTMIAQQVLIGNTYSVSPIAVAVGTTQVFVSNQADVISVFDLSGNFVKKIGTHGSGPGQLMSPGGIALDAAGNVYVADAVNSRIEVFDADGNFLRNFGSLGKISYPPTVDIEIDASDNVFVLDGDNRMVKVFNTSGILLRSFAMNGGQPSYPGGIDVDDNGNVYVADYNFNGNSPAARIQKFDGNGNFISVINRTGVYRGIGITSAGKVYSADGNCQCVRIIDPPNADQRIGSGIQTGRQGDFYGPNGIAISSTDEIYVTDSGNDRIQVFNGSGDFVREFGSGSAAIGQLKSPIGIAMDASNKIYVADSQNNRIQIFNADGSFNSTFGGYGNGDGLFNYGFNPREVEVDASGNIYALDGTGRAQVFSSNGVYTRSIGATTSPIAMILRGTDVVIGQPDGDVKVYDNSGILILEFGKTGPPNEQIVYAGDIATDADGNFYIADSGYGAYRVMIFSSTGTFVRSFGSYGTANEQFSGMGGIAVDATGKIYVTDDNRIKVFDNTGNLLGAYGKYGSGAGELIYPRRMYIKGNTMLIGDQTRIQTLDLTIGFKQSQTISFDVLPAKKFDDADFTLTASASSALPVTYESSNLAVATISGDKVIITGAGTTTITAKQEGDNTYISATPKPQMLTISKADAVITFEPLQPKKYGDPSFALGATSNASTGFMYESSNINVAYVNTSGQVSIYNVGTTDIKVSQYANDNFNAPQSVTQTLTVSKADQILTFDEIPVKTFGDVSFYVSAGGALSPVKFSSSDLSVATVSSNIVTIVGAGTATIKASQAGDDNNNPVSVDRVLTVNKASQSIFFSSLADVTLGAEPFTLTATASSGLSVTFSTASGQISLSNNKVSMVGAGRASVKASQAGNSNYKEATAVDQSFCVNPPKPVITSSDTSIEPIVLTSSNDNGNQWYFNTAAIADGKQKTQASKGNGTYSVITTVDDCVSLSSNPFVLSVATVTGDIDIGKSVVLDIYPNPVNSELSINVESETELPVAYQLMDALGRTVFNNTGVTNRVQSIDLKENSKGIYFVKVQVGKQIFHKQLVKQ